MKCFDSNQSCFESAVQEEANFLIEKPNVPFTHKLNGKLQPNSTFIIQGIVADNALRFEVNLVAGLNEKQDIVFHFNPRLDQLYTARNSRFSGAWGPEEGCSQLKFPFRCGQPFHLEICTTDVKFLVAVDGIHYCTYKLRTSASRVIGLQVAGDVRLAQVQQFRTTTYPSLLPQLLLLPDTKPSHNKNSAQGVSVTYNLQSPLQPKSSIIVQGVVNEDASSFRVDLLICCREKNNIGFHFNPRLEVLYTARNSRLGSDWGPEEGGSDEKFPFQRGKSFYLEIYATEAKFLIAVDGAHYCTYKYRAPLADIVKVHVHGGVTLSNVHLQTTVKYPSPLPQFLTGSEDKLLLQAGDSNKNFNLKVPFIQELKSRLQPQSSIIVQGVVDNRATRFQVDLKIRNDRGEVPDVAFHLNPRMDKLYVARNSRFNGDWGLEEGHSERKFPFHYGQPFFLEIYLTESNFMVAVDGMHYCSYKYRASLVSITSMSVEGGVRLSQIQLHVGSSYPTPPPECLPCPDIQSVVLHNDALLSDMKMMTFIHKLDFTFYPQSSLIVQGAMSDNGVRFAINLVIDYGTKQDIAFHFNPRLSQAYTARNSRIGGTWGTEEGSSKEKFPFCNGASFYLEFFFTHSKFMVAVNGLHNCSFKYRIPLAKITSVEIEGGVTVSQVLAHSTSSYPSQVLEFVPSPENKPILQTVHARSSISINQALPFVHELRAELHPQSAIIVQGVVDCRAIRLEINFLMGRGERPDIAFHFNPRMDQFYTARNSRLEGCWGLEEGNSHQRFPFVRGEPFYLEIFLTHSEFLVAANGIHYCSFGFRTALRHVSTIEVMGVTGTQVDVRPASTYPSPLPADVVQCPYKLQLVDCDIIENSSQITPVYGALKGNLRKNSKIEVRGKVKLLPYSFFVNLQEGDEFWPHPLVPLHISVRFCQGGDQVALANSWTRKKWGAEELVKNKFHFTPGYPFTLQITCQDESYVVQVDDQLLLAFKHRLPYNTVDTLLIQGDVFVYDISVNM